MGFLPNTDGNLLVNHGWCLCSGFRVAYLNCCWSWKQILLFLTLMHLTPSTGCRLILPGRSPLCTSFEWRTLLICPSLTLCGLETSQSVIYEDSAVLLSDRMLLSCLNLWQWPLCGDTEALIHKSWGHLEEWLPLWCYCHLFTPYSHLAGTDFVPHAVNERVPRVAGAIGTSVSCISIVVSEKYSLQCWVSVTDQDLAVDQSGWK